MLSVRGDLALESNTLYCRTRTRTEANKVFLANKLEVKRMVTYRPSYDVSLSPKGPYKSLSDRYYVSLSYTVINSVIK